MLHIVVYQARLFHLEFVQVCASMGVIKLIIVMLAILNELDFNFLNDGTYNLNEFNILYVVVTS